MSCRCKAPQPAVFFFEDEQGLDAAVKAWNLLQALLRK
jgi:hypothetical protein